MAKLKKECSQFAELASIFELTDAMGPVTAALKELSVDLVAAKDVWDCISMCEIQFQVSDRCSLHEPSACTKRRRFTGLCQDHTKVHHAQHRFCLQEAAGYCGLLFTKRTTRLL